MARSFSGKWEGIEYSAKVIRHLHFGRRVIYPYFVGDVIKLKISLRRVNNEARKFDSIYIIESAPQQKSPIKYPFAKELFSSFSMDDKRIDAIIEKNVPKAGEIQIYFVRGNLDEEKIVRVLFSGEIENNDQYILKFVFPVFAFFVGVILPILWKYVLQLWGLFICFIEKGC